MAKNPKHPERVYTLTTAKIRPADLTTAQRMVAEYRDNGNGSNRTKWERVTIVLASVLTAIHTGKSVNLTDVFTGRDGTNDERETSSSGYNIAHRALSHGAIRPFWHEVQIVALTETKHGKNTVTGVSNTTLPIGQVEVFVSVPV